MKWVLLFFCAIFLLIILIILSTIKINIKKIYISNYENGVRKKLEKEFLIYLEIYLFGKIKIAKINLNKNIFTNMNIKTDMKSLRKNLKTIKTINIFSIINKLKIQVENAYLNTEIGTDDVIFTAFLVTLISSIAGILFRKTNQNNVYFKVMPLYNNEIQINFNFNCIFKVKMVHIIYVILIFVRKGMKKNERTSNRRSYDYSYE